LEDFLFHIRIFASALRQPELWYEYCSKILEASKGSSVETAVRRHRQRVPALLMDRRYGWRAAGLGLIVVTFLAGCARREAANIAPTRRHVLLLTVDTLRNDYLSGNGYDRPTTPFLDQILRNGSKFTHAITPIPRTTPALASLLTGVYPKTTQVRTLVDTLSPRVATLAELLKARGYATLAILSNHILIPQRGLNRGFDVYDHADDARDAAATTAAALAHLRGYTPRDAVFLMLRTTRRRSWRRASTPGTRGLTP
jgi:hypothetical protein